MIIEATARFQRKAQAERNTTTVEQVGSFVVCTTARRVKVWRYRAKDCKSDVAFPVFTSKKAVINWLKDMPGGENYEPFAVYAIGEDDTDGEELA